MNITSEDVVPRKDGLLEIHLAIGPATPVTNVPHAQANLTYKLDSFEYVCQTFRNDFTISVRAESPYRTLAELMEALKKEPGKLTYGHSGHASIPHLAARAMEVERGVPAARLRSLPSLPDWR